MVDRLTRELEQGQNPDGGWSYRTGRSWTEPTCFALLALASIDGSHAARQRGRSWLLRQQKRDGGWSPEASITVSTWVTSLAAMALASEASAKAATARGIEWLKTQVGRQSLGMERLRAWFLGSSHTAADEGWPWFPGTASWVMPTALAVVALSKSRALEKDRALAARVSAARSFLLSRRCADGGWNHGGSLVRSEGADSYAETTGMALLAFPRECNSVSLKPSLDCLERWLTRADSVEAESWARIALSAHGRMPPGPSQRTQCWTHYERALYLLAEACRCGRNELAIAKS